MSKFRNMLVNNKGFTLIELLVVIAVLGILAAIAIPRLTGVTSKARLSEAESTLGTMSNAMEMYYTENNDYDASPSTTFSSTLASNLSASDSAIFDYIDVGSLAENWKYTIESSGSESFTITMVGATDSANEGLEASIDETGNINTTQ